MIQLLFENNRNLSLIFCGKNKKGKREMKTIVFMSLDEVFECYGRENLVAIDNLKQIIFYTGNGCQPKFVCENELKPGKITAWFLKDETSYVYKKWKENKPEKQGC